MMWKRRVDLGQEKPTKEYLAALDEYNKKIYSRYQHPEIYGTEKPEGTMALHAQAPAFFRPGPTKEDHIKVRKPLYEPVRKTAKYKGQTGPKGFYVPAKGAKAYN